MARIFIRYFILLQISLLPLMASAAPFPAMGSSILVSPQKGFFLNREGISLSLTATDWVVAEPTEEASALSVRYHHPFQEQAAFSVRVNNLETSMTLESYAKKWLKDYSNYGFEVLGSQTFTQTMGGDSGKGLVVDLIHKEAQKQARQIIFVREKKAVVLTCSDEKKAFASTLPVCNQIIKTFHWVL